MAVPKYPELLNGDWLYARYVEDGLSLDQIAELIGFDVPAGTVAYWLGKHGIPTRANTRRAPNGRSSCSEGRAPRPTGCYREGA